MDSFSFDESKDDQRIWKLDGPGKVSCQSLFSWLIEDILIVILMYLGWSEKQMFRLKSNFLLGQQLLELLILERRFKGEILRRVFLHLGVLSVERMKKPATILMLPPLYGLVYVLQLIFFGQLQPLLRLYLWRIFFFQKRKESQNIMEVCCLSSLLGDLARKKWPYFCRPKRVGY